MPKEVIRRWNDNELILEVLWGELEDFARIEIFDQKTCKFFSVPVEENHVDHLISTLQRVKRSVNFEVGDQTIASKLRKAKRGTTVMALSGDLKGTKITKANRPWPNIWSTADRSHTYDLDRGELINVQFVIIDIPGVDTDSA